MTEEGRGIVGMRASTVQAALARLADELSHGHSEFDRYLQRANITIED